MPNYETLAAGNNYNAIGASATDSVVGSGTETYLSHIVISPGAADCGTVVVKDGSTTIYTFAGGGTTALPTLAPIVVPFGMRSKNGAWKISTGANVEALVIGNFP